MNYLVGLKNSASIVLFGTLGQIISCSLAGYGFARFKFPGRDCLFMLVLFTFIVPPQTIIVPAVYPLPGAGLDRHVLALYGAGLLRPMDCGARCWS